MIRLTVMFWHSLRISGNANDEQLAKINILYIQGEMSN